MKNNKKTVYLILLITVIMIVVTVSTYAYFQSRTDVNASAPLNVATANGSVFTASSEGDIVLDVTFDKMTEAGSSTNIAVSDNATVTVRLDSEDETSVTSCTYDIVWVWDSSDKYIESDVPLAYEKDGVSYPYELSAKIDAENETDLSNYTWAEVNGKIETILASKEITVSGKGSTTNTHIVDVQVYNIPTDQQKLFNKNFQAHIEVKNNKCTSTTTQVIAVASNNSHEYDGTQKSLDIDVTNGKDATIYFSTTTELTAENYTSGSTTKPTRSEMGQTTVYWCAVAENYKPYCSNDKITVGKNLANYIINEIYISEGAKGIYHHDGKGTYINANLEAEDNSYRYSGANPDNYLCFKEGCTDDEKYRIIGVIDNRVKVIKMTSVGIRVWDSSNANTWQGSTMETYLNGEYLTSLADNANLIDTIAWHVGGVSFQPQVQSENAKGIYSIEQASRPIVERKIGLMYINEYMYAAAPSYWNLVGSNMSDATKDYRASKGNNWMLTANRWEWIISRRTDYEQAIDLWADGRISFASTDSTFAVARPTFSFFPSVKYVSGTGTIADPYIISAD